MASSATATLNRLLAPVVEAFGCELWGLEFHTAGRKRGLLRLYIDKEDGVGLEDCEKVSRQVSSVLDVEDPIRGEYVLEVSSPGMDRPLYTEAQFQQYVGARVRVKLRQAFEGRRQFSGVLSGIEDQEIKLIVDDHEYLLPLEAVDKANVIPQFADNTVAKRSKGRKTKGKKTKDR